MTTNPTGRSKRSRWATAATCVAIGLSALPAAAHTSQASGDGITLYVFGPNNTQRLAADAAPEVQAQIQQEVIDGFLAENPDVADVVWDAEGDRENSTQRLITANLSDQTLDLIACDANGTNSSYVRNGVLQPFSPAFIESIADRIDPNSLADYTIDGETYGVPLSAVSVTTMFYNADLLAELGVEPPTTYEELLALSAMLEESDVGTVGFQGSNTPFWSIWYTEALAQTQEDPVQKANDNLAGAARFDDPSDVEAFELISQWVDDGVLSDEVLGLDREGMLAEFAAGRVAMIFDGTFRIPQIQAAVDFTWGASPFPTMPTASYEARHGGGPDRGMCLSAKIAEDRIPAAESFVEYLTRPEVANVFLAPLSPIQSSILGVDVAQDDFAVQLRENVYPNRIKYLDWIWPTEVTATINASLQGLVSGSLSPADAAAAVQQSYDELVEAGDWPPSSD